MTRHVSHFGLKKVDGGPRPESSRLTLRPVEPGDADAIHRLLVPVIPDVIGDRNRWLARWRWQYQANPWRKDRPMGWVLLDADRVVGHLGAVYLPVRLGDKSLTGVVGADYAVSPEALAAGDMFAGLRLAEAFFDAVGDCVALATTANEKTGAVFGRYGCEVIPWTREFWRAPVDIAQMIRVCRGGRRRLIRWLMRNALMRKTLVHAYRCVNHTPAIPVPAGGRLETTVPRLARDLGALWQAATSARNTVTRARTRNSSPSVTLTVERSQDYLDWRYGEHPEREHIRVVMARDTEGAPIGAVVVFFEHRADRYVAFIEEMIVYPRRKDVSHALLSASMKIAFEHGADWLISTTGRPAIRDLFWQMGFYDRARSAPALLFRMPLEIQMDESRQGESGWLPDHLEFWHGDMF